MKKVDTFSMVVILIGALNWGFVGVFGFDFIDFFLESPFFDRLAYMLIGTAALFKIIYFMKGRWKIEFQEKSEEDC